MTSKDKPTVVVKPHSYQPTKAEKEETVDYNSPLKKSPLTGFHPT